MRDFGAGLTFDDLIGLSAMEINRLILPKDRLGDVIHAASQRLIENQFGTYLLMELWGDGHSVWQNGENGDVVVISPTGQLSTKQD